MGLFGDLHWCHQSTLLLRPDWVIWWRKQLKCKSSCLGHYQASWMLGVSLSFFKYCLLFCCRVCGTKAGTHLWCIPLSLHFRKSSVGTVYVSSRVPSLPPVAEPGSKKDSIGKGWVKGCKIKDDGPWNQQVLLHSWAPGMFASEFCAHHSAGAASLPPQHPTSAGSKVMLERTGYTGKDWLHWWGLTLVLVLPAFFTLWLYHLLESTIQESTVLEPPLSLHR